MHELPQFCPDADVVLAMEPEELAGIILKIARKRREMFILSNCLNDLFGKNTPSYPRERQGQIEKAISEAFSWLEAQVLIVRASGTNGNAGWRVLSRRAEAMSDDEDFTAFRAAKTLPRELMHPSIVTQVWLTFIRRDYDTAVFQGMKAVEVAVRDAGGYAETELGVALMRKAFDKDTGPLTDRDAPMSEREALAHLFAGAIGSYKNPHSHRNVPLNDPVEVSQILILASHLLRIVDDRRARFASKATAQTSKSIRE